MYFGRLLDGLDLQDIASPIYRVDLNTGRANILPGTQSLWTPRISPDGQTLAAFSSDNRRLVLIDLRNGSSQTVYQTQDLNDAIWSPDGAWLWFDNVAPAHPEVLRLNTRSRLVEHVVDLTSTHRAGLWGPWLGLTRDGSPLLLNDAGFSELYEIQLNLP